MIAIGTLLLPSIIFSILYFYVICEKKKKSVISILIAFISSFVIVNLGCLLIVYVALGMSGNLLEMLNTHLSFAVKYTALSMCFLGVLFIFTIFYEAKKRPSVFGYKVLCKIPWRLLISIYGICLWGINFIRIFDNNFWGDEAWSIKLAQMPFRDMLSATAGDVHPPLYYIILMAAYRIFGNQPWMYHAVSLIPYSITIILALTIVWKKYGKEATILLISFASLLKHAVYFNIEARMYSWTMLFIFLTFFFFKNILDANSENVQRKNLVCFVICSLCTAYLHYYGAVSVAFLYLALLIRTIRKQMKWSSFFVACISTIVGYVPWLTQFITTFKRTSEDYWIEYIPGIRSCALYYFETERKWFSYGMLFLTIIALTYMLIKHDKDSKLMLWGAIAAFGTAVFGVLISYMLRPVFLERYLYPTSILLWLILAISVSKLKNKQLFATIILIVTLSVCLPEFVEQYTNDKNENERSEMTKQVLLDEIEENDVILTNGYHLTWTLLDYYLPKLHQEEANIDDYSFSHEKQYYLVWNADLTDDEIICLRDNGYESEEIIHQGNISNIFVNVYRLKTRADSLSKKAH